MAPPELTWRPPRPSAIERISPSLLATWMKCRLRAGFQLNPATRGLRRTGLRAAVGLVAQKVLERSYGSQEQFSAAWAVASEATQDRLAREWAPATPPSPQHWPGWALTKQQVARRVVRVGTEASGGENVVPRAAQCPTPRHAARATLPWRERQLDDARLGLAGRPDLVERIGGVLTVVDFKTRGGDITSDQRDQLLIYAALVRSVFGELPAHAETRRADGSMQGFGVQTADVDEVVQRALDARATLKEAASRGRSLEATSGPETCPACTFRVACGPFLQAYQPDWACGHVAAGRIVGGLLGAQRYFDLEMFAPHWRSRHLRAIGLTTHR